MELFISIDRFLIGITPASSTLKSPQSGGFNVEARGWLNLEEDNKVIRFLFVFKRLRMNRIDFLRGSSRLC